MFEPLFTFSLVNAASQHEVEMKTFGKGYWGEPLNPLASFLRPPSEDFRRRKLEEKVLSSPLSWKWPRLGEVGG